MRSAGCGSTGAALPIWLWSACVAAGIGVALTTCVLVPLRRQVTGRWPRNPYPLVLAAVVAGGFLVRVATWLTIAPQKTDGGDPLFYHVTANTIARGRGFPEPLNWLDSATQIPSALHGPLYPVVLSVSSRLGGTTYVDHKFVSILIGSAIVLGDRARRRTHRWPAGGHRRRRARRRLPQPVADRQPVVPRGPVRAAHHGLHPGRLQVARSPHARTGRADRRADRPVGPDPR